MKKRECSAILRCYITHYHSCSYYILRCSAMLFYSHKWPNVTCATLVWTFSFQRISIFSRRSMQSCSAYKHIMHSCWDLATALIHTKMAWMSSCGTSKRSEHLVDYFCEVIIKKYDIYWCPRSLFAQLGPWSFSMHSYVNLNYLNSSYWIVLGNVSPPRIF